MFVVAKSLSKLLLRVLKCSGTSVFVANGPAAGQKAQHFMIHIIPRKEADGLFNQDDKLIELSLQQKVQTAIQNKLNELLGVKSQMISGENKTDENDGSEADEQEDDKVNENQEGENQENEDENQNYDKDPDAGADKESDEESDEDDNSEAERKKDVSLDDIANLFK